MTMDRTRDGACEAARVISATFGKSRVDKVWADRRSMPFDEFSDILTALPAIGSKDGSCFVPAVFREDKRRMDLADQIDIAVLDSDSGNAFEKIIAAVEAKGWRAVVHSTHSHLTDRTEVSRSAFDKWRKDTGLDDVARYMLEKKGYLPQIVAGAETAGEAGPNYIVKHQRCPKFRVVIPLARPWRAADFSGQREANEKWAERIGALAAALGLDHDQSCIDTSRLFYLPRVPSREARDAFQATSIQGEACDIWGLPPAPAEEEPRQDAPRAAATTKAGRARAGAGTAETPSGARADAPARAGDQIDLRRAGDRNGRSINLRKWSVEYGPRFEAVTALKTRAPQLFGNRQTGVKHHIQCPFDDEHTASNDRTGTYVVNSSEISRAALPSFTAGFFIGCKHNACAGRDRLAFIHKMLEQGTLTVADLTDVDFLVPLPELPPFPLPKRSGERAGRTVRRLMRRFMDRLEKYFAAKDWRDAEVARRCAAAGLDAMTAARSRPHRVQIVRAVAEECLRKFGPAERPVWQIAGGAGTGKTSAFIDEYRRRPALWRRHIWVAEQTRDMCAETRDKINMGAPEGMPTARTILGRTARGMCEFPDLANKVGPHVKSTFRAICKGEHSRCPYFDSCGYNLQFTASDAREPRIWVVAHQRLSAGQPTEIALPDPELVVVDESAISTLTRTISVDPEAFGRLEAYAGRIGDEMMAPAYAELGRHVAAIVMTGGDIKARLWRELPYPPEKIKSFVSDAAEAAARAAAKNGGIVPNDAEDSIDQKLVQIQRNASAGVAATLAQLSNDLTGPHARSVTWRPAGKDDQGQDVPGRILHHGRHVPSRTARAALLILDADAITEANWIIFGRKPRAFRVEGRRLGRFIQSSSGEFPKSTLIPKNLNADRVARSESLLGRLLTFARGLWASGSRVLVITNRPVHLELRGLAIGGDADDELGMATKLESGLEITHFNAYTGRDFWKDFDTAIIIGREQIKPEHAEELARRIYGDDWCDLQLGEKYRRASRRYAVGDDRKTTVWAHPDRKVQELVELTRERMTAQGVDRLRLMHPDGRSLRIFLFCDLPIPGVVPDVLATTDQILSGGSRVERAIFRGFAITNPDVMAKEFPDLWGTPKAAKHDIARAGLRRAIENQEKTQDAIYTSYCNLGLFLEIQGSGGKFMAGEVRKRDSAGWLPKWSRFLYGDGKVDRRRPDITIARHLELQHIDELELRGPAAEAIAAARAKDAKLGRLASLSTAKGKLEIGSAEFWRDVFATHPTQVITEDAEGRQVESWRDYTGKPIPRPIDAPPLPPPMTEEEKARSKAAFARWLAGRELAKIVETDPDGMETVTIVDVRSRRPIWRGRRRPKATAA